MKVITRFPPSPTGNLHIGSVRTALFNYLFARHHGGKIHLRFENTDEERSKREYEQNILDSLSWLGLTFDPICDKQYWRQSERKEIYRTYLKKLVDTGKAYISKESATTLESSSPDPLPHRPSVSRRARERGAEGKRRDEVIRFKNPNKKISFEDLIRGHIEFDTTELGDMVIAKSLEEPLYHLAVVIDDSEMDITHVLRGEDHISNTPRQILLQEALGLARPAYAHIPLILAPDRSKLSKRHGAVSVTEYRDRGYLKEALLNYLALLGWNPGSDREIFSLAELVQVFDLSKVQKGGAIFNEEKLRWINKEYLRRVDPKEFVRHIPESLLAGKTDIQRESISEMLFARVSVSGAMQTGLDSGEFEYLSRDPTYEKELLRWKKSGESPTLHLEAVRSLLENLPAASFRKSRLKEVIFPYAEEKGKGNVLWPMRVALAGRAESPDPFALAAMLGKEVTLRRLSHALNSLR